MASSRDSVNWNDPDVRSFLEAIVGAIKSIASSENRENALIEAMIAQTSRSRTPVNYHTAWNGIVTDPQKIVRGEYLMLRQGLGRDSSNRLEVVLDDGQWTLRGDRIADALGLAIGTPGSKGDISWQTVPLGHGHDPLWRLPHGLFTDRERVTFVTFNESEITSGW